MAIPAVGYELLDSQNISTYAGYGHDFMRQKLAKEDAKMDRNICKIFGAIPVLGGILVGIQRIKYALNNKLENKVAHIFRGILEILGLGILFTIPDICYYVKWKKMETQSLNAQTQYNSNYSGFKDV